MLRKIALLFALVFSVAAVNAQSDSLQEYTGKYIFPAGSVVPEVEVTLSDSTLSMSSTAGTSVLAKEGKDRYTIIEFNGWAEFKRNESGKVNAVHIEAGGYVLDGTKDEKTGWTFYRGQPAVLKATD